MGDDSGHAGFLSQPSNDGCQGLLALLRIRGWEALDYQDHAINEWRTKTTGQLLPDAFCFAAFDTGRSLQMALGVKRKGKKRNDGGKDYPGDPKTAHIHETHDVIQNRRQLSDIDPLRRIKGLQRLSSRPAPERFAELADMAI